MKLYDNYFNQNISVIKAINEQNNLELIKKICDRISHSLCNDGKILILGNGGSASDSMHIASEFVGRFKIERNAIPAIALTSNQAILTAIANDYSYEDIFLKQVQAIGNNKDILICLTTSGKSKNVLKAINYAKGIGMTTVGITGNKGSIYTDYEINIPSDETSIIQNVSMIILHYICGEVEKNYLHENRNRYRWNYYRLSAMATIAWKILQ